MQKELAAQLSYKYPVGLVSCNFDHLNVLSTVAVTDCGKIRLNLLYSCAGTQTWLSGLARHYYLNQPDCLQLRVYDRIYQRDLSRAMNEVFEATRELLDEGRIDEAERALKCFDKCGQYLRDGPTAMIPPMQADITLSSYLELLFRRIPLNLPRYFCVEPTGPDALQYRQTQLLLSLKKMCGSGIFSGQTMQAAEEFVARQPGMVTVQLARALSDAARRFDRESHSPQRVAGHLLTHLPSVLAEPLALNVLRPSIFDPFRLSQCQICGLIRPALPSPTDLDSLAADALQEPYRVTNACYANGAPGEQDGGSEANPNTPTSYSHLEEHEDAKHVSEERARRRIADQIVLRRLREALQTAAADPRQLLTAYLKAVAYFRLYELGPDAGLDYVRLDSLSGFLLLDQATLTIALTAAWVQGRLDVFERLISYTAAICVRTANASSSKSISKPNFEQTTQFAQLGEPVTESTYSSVLPGEEVDGPGCLGEMRRLGRLLWTRVCAGAVVDAETAEALLEQLCGLFTNSFLASCLAGSEGSATVETLICSLRQARGTLENVDGGLDPEYCLNAVPLLQQAQMTAEQQGLTDVSAVFGEIVQLLKY